MGVKERREREREKLRQEILDAARELFVKEGYENVSMRKIAERIEYSPTTIYLYFQDKEELLERLCEETFAKLDKKIRSFKKEGDPVATLKRGLRAYIEFGLKHPNHYKVTFMMDRKPQPHKHSGKAPYSLGEKAFNNLRAGVARCIAQGSFPDQDSETLSQTLWAAVHGLTSLLITRCEFPWVDRNQLIDTLLDTLVGGARHAEPSRVLAGRSA